MRRRRFVATTACLGTAVLAGCSGTDGSGGDSGGTDDGSDGGGGGSGSFRLLISDQPAAIEDFDSLDVTLSSARVFRADGEETPTPGVVNETAETTDSTSTEPTADEDTEEDGDDETEGFVEFEFDDATVDLTQVTGERAVAVLESELETGQYSGIELRVASAEGVVEGETVDVKVPSNRLRIVKPFEIAADAEVSFVFDIRVVQKGPQGGYNLLPVIGKSGVAGEDVDVEEVDDEDESGEETATPESTETAGGSGVSTETGDDPGY